MIRNHLIISFRTLWRNKTYSLISIVGLAVGLASGILIFLWIQDEMSYDDFHSHPEKLHRLVAQLNLDGKVETYTTTVAPLAVFGKQEIPAIINACRISEDASQYLYQYKDKILVQEKIAFVDDTFFEMFNFPLIQGNPKKPFSTRVSVVLTETTAKKYFGTENPIGKALRINNKYEAEVSGIIKTIPNNSNFQYEVLSSFDVIKEQFLESTGRNKTLDEDWDNFNYNLFFQIDDPAKAAEVGKGLQVIHQKNQHDELISKLTYILEPIERMHLYNPDGSEGSMLLVKIMAMVAAIIIIIACINYVNLATAQAMKRAKEVSLRKIIGVNNSQLFGRFFCESFVLFVAALTMALIIIAMLIPVYNEISGKHLIYSDNLPQILLVSCSTLLVTLILSGAYPAWMLSIFKISTLQGVLVLKDKNIFLRKGLVIVQFVFSIILAIATIIIGMQLDYIRTKNLGYKKENILTFEMREMGSHFDAAKTELIEQPGVLGVSVSGQDLLNVNSSTNLEWVGNQNPKRDFMIKQLPVDRDFLKVLDIKLIEGNGFSNTPTDSTNYILNEAAVKAMGFKDPIGAQLKFHERNGTIVGIVKDFHYQSLHQPIAPLIIYYDPFWRWKMYVRVATHDAINTIKAIEKVYKKYNPDFPFAYSFLDDDFIVMYRTDQTIGQLFFFFAGISIFISCMGLFALASYTTETRTKEIGIRKVLGASGVNIGLMLSKDFIKLVLIAIMIAFPLAWLVLNKLLESYAYRVALSWSIFAISGFLALSIAILTISSQAVRAALTNPVKLLRAD
jgi:putative ABC transport system permease protein